MTANDFCYWLNGFFELSGNLHMTLSSAQVDTIRRHLALVFVNKTNPADETGWDIRHNFIPSGPHVLFHTDIPGSC